MNNCTFVGRLTKDPELKKNSNGTPMVTFNLGCNRPRSDKVDFIPFIVNGKQAENMQKYCVKGQTLYVTGVLQVFDKDGSTRMMVSADHIEYGAKPKNGSGGQPQNQGHGPQTGGYPQNQGYDPYAGGYPQNQGYDPYAGGYPQNQGYDPYAGGQPQNQGYSGPNQDAEYDYEQGAREQLPF